MPIRSRRFLRRGGAALTLGSALLLAGCFGESAQELLSSAKTHLEKKDQKAAIIQLKNALQKDDSLAEARFLLARALLESGDVQGAQIEADKAAAQGYRSDAATVLQARLLMAQGKVDAVIGQFANTHLATPADEAELQTTLVAAYVAKQRPQDARAAVDAALKVAPENVAVRLVHARLLAGDQKLDAAKADVERLLAQQPKAGEAWQLKGELQAQAGDAPAAVAESFRQALALDKQLVGAHVGLINALMKAGDRAAAKTAVTQMRAALPTHVQTYYYAAIFALEDGQLKEAAELSQALLKVAPNTDRTLYLAGRVAQANGDVRQAEVHFSRLVQLLPGSPQARVSLAQVQWRSGDADQALATLEPALSAEPPSADALALAAEIRVRQGRGEEAEALLARAAQANPGDVRSRIGLALGQIRKGQDAQGLDALRKLAAGDKGTDADLALISVLLRKQDHDGAAKAIAALDAKEPASATAPELRGRLALAQRDRAAARKAFEEAQRRQPASLTAAHNLAALDVQDKKPEDAAKRYDAVLKADPKNLRAALAQTGLRLNHRLATQEETVKRLNELAKAHPETPAPRLALVSLLVERKEYQQALTVAQEGLSASPDQPDLLEALGQVQALSGDRQGAAVTFNKLASAAPKSPQGLLRLADLQVRSGDKDAALAALKRAQGVAPGDPELIRKVVEGALSLGQPEAAMQAVKALQTAQPRLGAGWKLEGDVLRARKDWPGALAAYRKAEQLVGESGNTVAATELAIAQHSTLLQSGKADEARRFAEAWTGRNRQDALFRYHLGDVSLTQNKWELAEQHYQAVLAISPDNAAAANNIAWLKLRAGKPDEGLKLAERANELRPNVPPYMDTLAEALAAKGQTAKAIDLQREAVKQAPGVPAYRLRLAQLYVASGKKAEAQTELKTLAELGPRFEQQAEVQKLQAAIR